MRPCSRRPFSEHYPVPHSHSVSHVTDNVKMTELLKTLEAKRAVEEKENTNINNEVKETGEENKAAHNK